jgi:hypothetical protein
MWSVYAGASDVDSKIINVVLTTGTWQLVCEATFGVGDIGNYDFTNYATASCMGLAPTPIVSAASVRLFRVGGRGFGRLIYGTSMAVQTFYVASTNNSIMLTLGVPTIAAGYVYARKAILAKISDQDVTV